MTEEAIVLVGTDTPDAREVLRTHARRLRDRAVTDAVHTGFYGSEPIRDLRDTLESVAADAAYVVPMRAAHTHETTDDVPAALSYLPCDARYCEPVGRSSATTGVLAERAAARVTPGEDATLVLVAFGSSSLPYQRQTAEYHAARLREQSDYGEVVTSFLVQNPAVECARYNVSNDRAVAVPLFVHRSEATDERIPAKLELDRGGVEYADPLGAHPRITRAIRAEVEKQRILATDDGPASFEASLAQARRPVATDGHGAL
ncbi:CbiX/SirB N-terminal domain-containing protein [Halorussus sp. MSC15.2]|uniref:CbiX/SirB N-terminal domain-containing protein n=1 Tax=Halorussus sp. MSC15.2 TaxID=2283638 RepID=UPI0013D1B891|nr:CbiX/SirB N-terminal domain-containing protein [Halorussus sp. MSC15.2]NEU58226.1 sirohydrochlorin chelatase [Halorussus sp. MSC15.2]